MIRGAKLGELNGVMKIDIGQGVATALSSLREASQALYAPDWKGTVRFTWTLCEPVMPEGRAFDRSIGFDPADNERFIACLGNNLSEGLKLENLLKQFADVRRGKVSVIQHEIEEELERIKCRMIALLNSTDS
jgi:hypothetical protein